LSLANLIEVLNDAQGDASDLLRAADIVWEMPQ
jgi:hypothetical protein